MSSFTISGQPVELGHAGVALRMASEQPEPIREHYVVIGGRRFPPKQVVSVVTGVDRADFTTHQARRILLRLGFAAARRRPPLHEAGRGAGPDDDPAAEALRPFIGSWVAVRDSEVLVAASSAASVVSWLATHGETADAMFRLSGTDAAISGAAPS